MSLNFCIYISFLNLTFIPLFNFFALSSIQPGSLTAYRIASLFFIILLNLFSYVLLRKYPVSDIAIKNNWADKKFTAVTIIIFLIISGFYFSRSVYEPHGMWDAWAMWNSKSKDWTLSFLSGSEFKIAKSSWAHPGYPVFIPLLLSFIAINSGGWSHQVPLLTNYFYLILYFALIFQIAIQFKGKRNLFYYFLIVSSFLPALVAQATDQCADFPLSCHYAFTFFLFFRYQKNPSLTGAGLLAIQLGMLSLIKMEGAILFTVLFLYFIYVFLRNRNREEFIVFLVFVLPATILFLLFKLYAPEINPVPINQEQLRLAIINPQRYFNVLHFFAFFHLLTILLCPFVILSFFFKLRFQKMDVYFPILASHIAYNIIFLITSSDQIWHLSTAYIRINLQLIPAFCLISLFLYMENDSYERG